MNNVSTKMVTNTIKIPNIGLIACMMAVEEFRDEFVSNRPYSQSNLKKAYRNISGIQTNKNINFFISGENVYLVPESGEGVEKDLEIINFIKSLMPEKLVRADMQGRMEIPYFR